MSTNARHPTCDIKTNHLTPNEAADTSLEVEILSDMHVTKSVVERKMWDVSAVIGRYLSTDFIMSDAKEEYWILKNDVYMIEFDWSTTIRKASVKAYGFVRYPFQLQCNTPKNRSQRNMFPGALLHNTIAQVMRE
ncbi:hypothetical protein Tco_1028062 [Tanacetum coccineum]